NRHETADHAAGAPVLSCSEPAESFLSPRRQRGCGVALGTETFYNAYSAKWQASEWQSKHHTKLGFLQSWYLGLGLVLGLEVRCALHPSAGEGGHPAKLGLGLVRSNNSSSNTAVGLG
ncbi:unnamed protein product, partial [Discosporangium mesarthrocarpum]